MNAFRRREENHLIDSQVDMVSNRNKSGNINPMNRQQLINIVSKSWDEVMKKSSKSFELVGRYGLDYPEFMKHQTI